MNTANEIIEEIFTESTKEIIKHYSDEQPTWASVERLPLENQAASILGFGEDHLRGSSVLAADPKSICSLANCEIENPLDWLGELNNQIVGRLKNRLAGYGVNAHMGTPMSVQGTDLDLVAVGQSPESWRFRWSQGNLFVMIALEVQPDFELTKIDTVDIAAEGSLSLF